ncbi:MAG: hypothetical protein QOE48_4560, partial [Mycobacterium sp.]|nr:hypothetical protein [Mycobacterium sp.]
TDLAIKPYIPDGIHTASSHAIWDRSACHVRKGPVPSALSSRREGRHVRYPPAVTQLTFQRARTEENEAPICGGGGRSPALASPAATAPYLPSSETHSLRPHR